MFRAAAWESLQQHVTSLHSRKMLRHQSTRMIVETLALDFVICRVCLFGLPDTHFSKLVYDVFP